MKNITETIVQLVFKLLVGWLTYRLTFHIFSSYYFALGMAIIVAIRSSLKMEN